MIPTRLPPTPDGWQLAAGAGDPDRDVSRLLPATPLSPPKPALVDARGQSLPLHSGYTFRTRAILKAQMARGWEVACLTGPRHKAGGPDPPGPTPPVAVVSC